MFKHISIVLLALQAALWLAQSPVQSADGAGAAAATQASQPPTLTLQGAVKHKEFLDPVSSGLMAGAKFDENALPKLTSANNWIPISAWLAGTWQFKNENVTDMVNYTKEEYTKPPYTIRNEAQKILGQQQDKSGQIWHYLKAPYSYTSKLNRGILGYERIVSVEALAYNDETVILRVVGSDTQVNPRSQVVVETGQAEDINRYTPLEKDSLVLHGSAKHFDMNGQPTMDMTSNMIAKRIKPFANIDEQDGDNLKQLFADFLKAQGKGDLIP